MKPMLICVVRRQDITGERFPAHKSVTVSYLLQGSYGIVKLAYNEEDDTRYVSTYACRGPLLQFSEITLCT